MEENTKQPATMLSPYRVLDLTDERGEIAGMVLGDLGADVIKVEQRNVGADMPTTARRRSRIGA